jgi:MarR family transcriptional regulator, organic hydroperoxide resistance regulator
MTMAGSSAEVVSSFGAAVRRMRGRLDKALQGIGLRLGQYQILRELWESDGLTPRELADRLHVEMPTVTRTVQRMLRDGLVRRQAHPADARSVRICLTPLGNELREAAVALADKEAEAALSGLSALERATLATLLQKIGSQDSAAVRQSE